MGCPYCGKEDCTLENEAHRASMTKEQGGASTPKKKRKK